jgi:hypothetical protein
MSLAQNWRRRGMFDEVAFIFPNAPMIPITVVCCDDSFDIELFAELRLIVLLNQNFGMTMPGWHDLTKLGREVRYPSLTLTLR